MNSDNMTARVAGGTGASHVRQRMTQTSPIVSGRIAGAFYLAIFVAGEIYSVLVPNLGLLNTIDAATLDHIVSHQTAFWAGYPFFLLVVAFRLILMLLFYELFKPVNKSIALLAVYFNIVATTMQAVMAITLLAPLVLLGGGHSLTALTSNQVHALALAALQLYNPIYYIALALFGCYDLLLGYLAFKSTFLPRPIGVLMGLAGLGWLTFFVPPIATQLLPYNLAAGLLGEGSMILWLLVKSVDAQKWREQESHASQPDRRVKGEAAV
jgi:Domain of unknown function (DUF4386)